MRMFLEPLEIRLAKPSDYAEIVEIYNWAIVHTAATFDTEIQTVDTMEGWFSAHKEDYPIFVALDAQQRVVGYVALTKWSNKPAYNGLAELTIYIHPDRQGQGMGTILIRHILLFAKERSMRSIVSQISDTSTASLHLHRKLGFVDVGIIKEAGIKFGEKIDVLILQYFINAS